MAARAIAPSLAASTAPIFTLGTALRWLGHDCPDRRCSQPIAALPVSMRFLRRGHVLPVYPWQAVIVLDPTETAESPARIHWLVDKINRCTRDDGHALVILGG